MAARSVSAKRGSGCPTHRTEADIQLPMPRGRNSLHTSLTSLPGFARLCNDSDNPSWSLATTTVGVLAN